MKYIIFFLISISGLLSAAAGRTAAAGFKLNNSARAAAMAGAYSAVSDTLDAVYYNPAGVFSHSRFILSGMFGMHNRGNNLFNLAAKLKTGPVGDFALSASGLIINSDTPATKWEAGEIIKTGGNVAGGELYAVLNYSRNIKKYLLAGINFKIINQFLEEGYHSFNLALDSGIILKAGFINKKLSDLHLGVSLQNAGPSQQAGGSKHPMPLGIRVALNNIFTLKQNLKLQTVLGINKYKDSSFKAALGATLAVRELVFIRAGYQYKKNYWQYGFCGGIGLKFNTFQLDWSLNYNEIGIKNIIQLTFRPVITSADTDKIQTIYNMGLDKFIQKKFREAQKYFQAVLRLNPEHETAHKRVTEIKEILLKKKRLQKFKQAMQEIK